MEKVKFCLFVSLAITCLVQPMMSMPSIIDGDIDYDTSLPMQITDDIYELKDTKDNYDPAIYLKRFRRQSAQWAQGSHHFNDDHETGSRRWAHRRQRQNQGVYGGGQIVDA